MTPNTLFDGRYELLEPLGEGGMATVYVAVDPAGRRVAIKRLRPERCGDALDMALFEREGDVLGQIDLPTVPHLYAVARCEGCPYLVMDIVDGKPLDRFAFGKPLRWQAAAQIIARAADVVDGVHRRGFVHRDLSPGNMVVTPSGRIGLIDFGLATSIGERPEVEPDEIVYGTFGYIAPERLMPRSPSSTPAVDIFSLGVAFYELITGRLPYTGEDLAEHAAQLLANRVTPLGAYLRDPAVGELSQVTLRALRADPAERYPSAAAFAGALRELPGYGNLAA